MGSITVRIDWDLTQDDDWLNASMIRTLLAHTYPSVGFEVEQVYGDKDLSLAEVARLMRLIFREEAK